MKKTFGWIAGTALALVTVPSAVVLWETLACKRLFRADDNASLIELVVQSPFDPPSKYNASVAKELDAVVLKGLARTWNDPYKFLYDAAKGLWAHHDKLGPNVV